MSWQKYDKLGAAHDPAVQLEVMRLMAKVASVKGGKARAEKLSPERRREISMIGAEARWRKTKPPKSNGEEALDILEALCRGPDKDLAENIARGSALLQRARPIP